MVSGEAPTATAALSRSAFRVAGMDCAAEEVLVRTRLERLAFVRSIDVDLGTRTVTVDHDGNAEAVGRALSALRLGAELLGSEAVDHLRPTRRLQARLLWAVLIVNALFFALEAGAGLLARSMGLLGDSLDMLADAVVYGMSLAVVWRGPRAHRQVARWSGYGQLGLAALGFLEVLRRALGARVLPDEATMIVVASLALVANVVTLALLVRARSGEAHIRASVIFTSNDVVLNVGVIVAGVLVGLTGKGFPDLVIGAIVFAVVARGALRILTLSR